jgi:predicted acetyltransferase
MRLVKASLEPPNRLLDAYREVGASENGFFGQSEVVAGKIPVPEHLRMLVDMAEGRNLRPGQVPMTTYWLLDDADMLAGVSRLRHRLTEDLLSDGGHIGYYVRPAFRGRGHGHTLLRLTLEEAKRLGIERALLTIADDNAPSIRVAERAGGVMEDERVDNHGIPYRRYWIDLT